MKIKVCGANGCSHVLTANNRSDMFKISKCYARWEYVK